MAHVVLARGWSVKLHWKNPTENSVQHRPEARNPDVTVIVINLLHKSVAHSLVNIEGKQRQSEGVYYLITITKPPILLITKDE